MPGPVDVWVDYGSGSSFFGWTKGGVHIRGTPVYTPVQCDVGGAQVRSDALYDGEEATISFQLNRFNYSVYQAISDRVANAGLGAGIQGSTRGADVGGELGTLVIGEFNNLAFSFRWPYALKPSMQNGQGGALEVGRRYVACYIANDDIPALGPRVYEAHMTVQAIRKFTPTQGPYGFGTWTLWDTVGIAQLGNLN